MLRALPRDRYVLSLDFKDDSFAGPQQVLDYLGRYTHRVAIANSRLINLEDGQVQFRWKDETAKNRRDDLQKQLEDAQLITVADDNRDGQLQEAELKSDMFKDFKANFVAIDADKSGALSGQELGAAMQEMAKREQAARAAQARGERLK